MLTDERESVGIVNHDETESIRFRMDALTEIVHLVANRMDTAVLFRAEPENGFNGEGGFLFEDFNNVFQEGCLSRAWRTCNENMGEVGHHFPYGGEDSILTIEATH